MKKLILLSIVYFLLSSSVLAQSVDLLWQGETYTPPFYEGKALWSKQTNIKFVAIPQGLGSPAALNYRWTRNGTVLGNSSGVGKNSIKFRDSIFSKPYTMRVEIVNSSDKVLAESSLSVTAQDPVLLVYEKNPLYGYMFHQEVGQSFLLDKGEATLSAFPLYAGSAEREAAAFSYRWRASEGVSSGNSGTYRAPEGAEGYAPVSLSFSDSGRVMRDIQKKFVIKFGNE